MRLALSLLALILAVAFFTRGAELIASSVQLCDKTPGTSAQDQGALTW